MCRSALASRRATRRNGATVLAAPAAPALADSNTTTPNPSAHFGQAGSADEKLELVNGHFGTEYEQVGDFMSEHVHSYPVDGPGRSGLAPNSGNANSNAG
jgi:hypothetical protein